MAAIKAAGKRGLFEVGGGRACRRDRGSLRPDGAGLAGRRRSTRSWAAASRNWSTCRSSSCSPTCDAWLPDLHRLGRRHRPDPRLLGGGLRHPAPTRSIGSSVKTRFEIQEERRATGQAGRAQQLRRPRGQALQHRACTSDAGRSWPSAIRTATWRCCATPRPGPGRGSRCCCITTTAAREFAYDREFRLSPLAEALDNAPRYGIDVVSMKRDWAEVFAA